MSSHRIAPQIIAVIGLPGAGKSTVSQAIAEHTGRKRGSCSDAIYNYLSHILSMPEAELRAIPKEALRPLLIYQGNQMCRRDPARLVKILHRHGITVIDGIRRRRELEKVCKCWKTFVVWVQPTKPIAEIVDNTELFPSDANTTFLNYWQPHRFEREIKGLCSHF